MDTNSDQAARRLIDPRLLTWVDVDPARHPFDPAALRDLPAAARVPARPAGEVGAPEIRSWIEDVGEEWANAMSMALVQRYGRWACGWRWAVGEGDYDGGPIRHWCCPSHSITTPEATRAAVTASLLEWRAWLEDLADRFNRFLPIPPGAHDNEVLDTWERAVANLVTAVVDRTDASSGWYTHGEQVLGWFLTAAEIPVDQHEQLIDDAIAGRFHSWVEPEPQVVDDVAERLAGTALRRRDA